MAKKTLLLLLFFAILFSTIALAQSNLPIGLQRLQQQQQQLASSITFFLAFFAGLISMTSPCGIALLPTFFAVAFKDKKRSMLMTVAFSIGLLMAFVMFGIIAGLLGDFFNTYKSIRLILIMLHLFQKNFIPQQKTDPFVKILSL